MVQQIVDVEVECWMPVCWFIRFFKLLHEVLTAQHHLLGQGIHIDPR